MDEGVILFLIFFVIHGHICKEKKTRRNNFELLDHIPVNSYILSQIWSHSLELFLCFSYTLVMWEVKSVFEILYKWMEKHVHDIIVSLYVPLYVALLCM